MSSRVNLIGGPRDGEVIELGSSVPYDGREFALEDGLYIILGQPEIVGVGSLEAAAYYQPNCRPRLAWRDGAFTHEPSSSRARLTIAEAIAAAMVGGAWAVAAAMGLAFVWLLGWAIEGLTRLINPAGLGIGLILGGAAIGILAAWANPAVLDPIRRDTDETAH